jgi:putative transport protein
MKWLEQFAATQPVPHGLLVLSVVVAVGLAIGACQIRGIGLGVAGTLFAGIFFGHFGWNVQPEVRSFLQEFGLILFVFGLGLQVGPRFIDSLRRQGLTLNLLATAIVLLGAALTILLGWIFNIDIAAAAGVLAGATTNTPSLGAAQEALKSLPGINATRLALPGVGYAAAYPGGILGIILSLLLIRSLFRIGIEKETAEVQEAEKLEHARLQRMNIRVQNPNLDGLKIEDIPGMDALQVVVSRIKRRGSSEVEMATPDTVIHRDDQILAVGTDHHLEQFRVIVGARSEEDLMKAPGRVTFQRVVVTRPEFVGRPLSELELEHHHGVTVTRLVRGEVEITVTPGLRLGFGDTLQIVGSAEAVASAAASLGNSVKELNHARLAPLFVGIALGVLVGVYPIQLGNMPAPMHLGLAGGPLLVAILLSNLRRFGPLLFYLPENANVLLRTLGIVLFLSCVGLKSGAHFVHTLLHGDGMLWMACGIVITMVPLLVVAGVARLFLHLNYVHICGLLSGSMTDPPALAFSNNLLRSDAASVSYAAVYPLTMLLRILIAQLVVLLFC